MKTLYIMCGVPGSGKSWYATNKLGAHSHVAVVSRDTIRFESLNDMDEYFSNERQVYSSFTKEIVTALKNPNFDAVVADATHINWASRRKLIVAIGRELLLDSQFCIIPVVMRCSLDQARRRNAKRTGRAVVPEDVIQNMYGRFQDPKRDPYYYDGILYVDNEREE